jgi:hypothetical protein
VGGEVAEGETLAVVARVRGALPQIEGGVERGLAGMQQRAGMYLEEGRALQQDDAEDLLALWGR